MQTVLFKIINCVILVVAKKILSFKILSNYELKSARTADETMTDIILMEKYKIQKGNIHNYKLVMDVAT